MNQNPSGGPAPVFLPEREVVDDEYARLPEQPSVADRRSAAGATSDRLAGGIRQSPLAAIVTALAVGAVLGLLLAR